MKEVSSAFDAFKSYVAKLVDFLRIPLFDIGKSTVTLYTLVYVIIASVLLVYISGKLRKILVRKILNKYAKDHGLTATIGTITRYIILVIGFIIIFQSVGFDLSTLSILAGALGVGIGFGLQNITNNFISGLIILFERPIKVGDRIQVGELYGDVVSISARSTNIITNDNISVIVPNSEFINNRVINWSHNDRRIRFRFPVGVSYSEDPQKVKRILLEVVDENPGVLDHPAPDVLFMEFGDSSLNFDLLVWTSDYINRPSVLRSQVYYAIFARFAEEGIEIPFPQRDLHLRSGFENLQSAPKN